MSLINESWYIIYATSDPVNNRHLLIKKSHKDALEYSKQYLPKKYTWKIRRVPESLVEIMKVAMIWRGK